jgi:hypothetical protein
MSVKISKILILLMVASVAIGFTGCKGKEKVSKKKAKAEYEAMVSNAKKDLQSIVDGTSTMTLSQKENRVAEIKSQNIDDNEVQDLIILAEEKLAAERSALVKKEMDDKKKVDEGKPSASASATLNGYFNSISNAKSVNEANMLINEALKLFSSPDAPVLIIISKTADGVDYDRPTTIKNYLNYLKDTKNNINSVEKITTDANGKIKELELIKNY